jgi:hypothetical protein
MATRRNKPWDKDKGSNPESSAAGRGVPANLQKLAGIPGESTPKARRSIPVLITVETAELVDLNRRVWLELNAKLVAVGGELMVTQDQLLRYFATAIYARTMWVMRQVSLEPTRRSFAPKDRWALPTAMAYIVNAIGVVETQEGRRYVPTWVGDESFILSRTEFEDYTAQLLAYEPYGLRFAKGFEPGIEGVDKVMTLIRVDEEGDSFFYAWVPPTALEAITAAVLGVRRTNLIDMDVVEPDMIPTFRIRGSWALGYMADMARMNEHRDVA